MTVADPGRSPRRGELVACLLAAVAIVFLQAVVPLTLEAYFDADQAVIGLMAKHLAEGRAFPLFYYGQNYMLGVQAWLAAPFFWMGGPTIAMLRTPVVILNAVVALAYVWFLARQGLRPIHALLAALPVIAFTPARAMELGAPYGAGIEPYGYALLLWILRRRPLAFGIVLGFGTLHREFTFLALPALAVACWRDPAYRTPRSLLLRAAGFAAIWLLVDVVKRNVNVYGPAGGEWVSGSVALGPQTFASWLSFDWGAYFGRVWQMASWGVPEMLGATRYRLRAYGIPADLDAGSWLAAAALLIALGIAAGRSAWLARAARLPGAWGRFGVYLAALAVFNVLLYGLNGGIGVDDPPILRYALFAPLAVIALVATYFVREPSSRWRLTVSLALVVWAATIVVDNGRLIRQVKAEPPPRPHRVMANYLMSRGITYARATYWDAYVITFLSSERVIVASTTKVRISAYRAEVDAHAGEAVTLQRLPCEGGTQVAAWCVIGPAGR